MYPIASPEGTGSPVFLLVGCMTDNTKLFLFLLSVDVVNDNSTRTGFAGYKIPSYLLTLTVTDRSEVHLASKALYNGVGLF